MGVESPNMLFTRYKGATASGLKHVIRRIVGSQSHVDQSPVTHKLNWIWKYSTNATWLLPRGRHWHFSGTSTAISLPQALMPQQQELMSWHHRLYHLPFNRILMLEKHGYLPKILSKLQNKPPLCVACQFGTAHRCPWCTKGKKSGSIQKLDQTKPGDGVSVDQIISTQPGLIPQMAGFLTSKWIWGCTTFVNHVSNYIHVHLMKDFTIIETFLAKLEFEKLCARAVFCFRYTLSSW